MNAPVSTQNTFGRIRCETVRFRATGTVIFNLTPMTTDYKAPWEPRISGDPAVDRALRIFGVMFV